jgi:hypothetical protein
MKVFYAARTDGSDVRVRKEIATILAAGVLKSDKFIAEEGLDIEKSFVVLYRSSAL